MTKTTQRIEQQNRFKGILSRLRKDTSGVALYMYAIGLVPIMASAGIGFDIGRAYLVRSKMQQACDAGAIAGRRSMAGLTIKDNDKKEAERFFRANFQNGLLGSKPIDSYSSASPNRIQVWQSDSGQLYMSAKTTVPTTLVSQFVGDKDVDVSVKCLGEEFFVNTDIMLVLDTTGSMNCAVDAEPTCGPNFESTFKSQPRPDNTTYNMNPLSKMGLMRSAIKTMYNDLEPIQKKLEAKGLRMRIGWVPYSTNVQVGHLIAGKSTSYIKSSYTYTYPDGTTANLTYSGSDTVGGSSTKWNGCIEERDTAFMSSAESSISSSAYDLDIATLPSSVGTRWALMPKIKKDWSWQFQTGKDRYNRPIYTNRGGEAVCAHKAVAMQAWSSKSAFNAEIDKIVTGDGGTHHDIGITWGARMLSDKGIFGQDNPTSHNKVEVSKVMVFMTDGRASYGVENYSAYGVMARTQRTHQRTSMVPYKDKATDDELETYADDVKAVHNNRFRLMCNAAREQGIDIWVVAILPSSSTGADIDAMRGCATVPNQMIFVGNTSELTNAFKSITDKVGNVRVGE
jgi:Flp pilus assembly protein TadG